MEAPAHNFSFHFHLLTEDRECVTANTDEVNSHFLTRPGSLNRDEEREKEGGKFLLLRNSANRSISPPYSRSLTPLE